MGAEHAVAGKADAGRGKEKADPARGRAEPGKSKEEDENPWGRVTLRAPFDGVVVERNVGKGELVVDNTINLFQIADVNRLLVKANSPEDNLPALEALARKNRQS